MGGCLCVLRLKVYGSVYAYITEGIVVRAHPLARRERDVVCTMSWGASARVFVCMRLVPEFSRAHKSTVCVCLFLGISIHHVCVLAAHIPECFVTQMGVSRCRWFMDYPALVNLMRA